MCLRTGNSLLRITPPIGIVTRNVPEPAKGIKIQSWIVMFVVLLIQPITACFAELADRDQPLFLEADNVSIDDQNKTSTFVGNVRFSQGTMLLTGDRIEIIKLNDGFKQARVYGNTASFIQKREGTDEFVEGYGEKIEYDALASTVEFFGQARVKRDLDEVRGNHIVYNMKTETFKVSSKAGSSDSPAQRVRAVLQPVRKIESLPPASPDQLTDNPPNTRP